MSIVSETARLIHKAFVDNSSFPAVLADQLSIEEAYQVQFELARLRIKAGEHLSGWKVGLTAKAMQQQQGVDEPCLGHLIASGHLPSPVQLSHDQLIQPGFENELCLLIKKTLEGPEISFNEARNAIGAVAPALEIIEKRSAFQADFPLAMAGNAQQRFYVTGAFSPLRDDMVLADIRADVTIGGVLTESAFGREVLGDPVHSVIWLVRKLHQFGHRLEAGQHVMSGSFTRQYPLHRGDRVDVVFGELGRVAVTTV